MEAPETIFDHHPTSTEMKNIFQLNMEMDTMCHGLAQVPMPVTEYRSGAVAPEMLDFDIGLLYFRRGDKKKATTYFKKTPKVWEKYKDQLR